MKKNQACQYFHDANNYNCAQAVLKAFQTESGMSELTIRSATVAGGGRANEGTCGALYAAHILLGDGESQDKVTKAFSAAIGSTKCSDIKKTECGCRDYVGFAAELAQQHLDKIDKYDPNYVSARESREIEMLPQIKK